MNNFNARELTQWMGEWHVLFFYGSILDAAMCFGYNFKGHLCGWEEIVS